MNKLFSYLYEIHWRFSRLDKNEQDNKVLFLSNLAITIVMIAGILSNVSISSLISVFPIVLISFILTPLIVTIILSESIIFEKFMSPKVRIGKEVDEKYKKLTEICYYSKIKEIKELSNFVFPKLLDLHGKKETREKMCKCFMIAAKNNNLDIVSYFVFEQNIKLTKDYRKYCKENYSKVEKVLVSRDLKNKLENDLPENKVEKISKPMKL